MLILGESGTGKELVAETVHSQSPRRNQRLLSVNRAAVPENHLESELFGYEKGTFTGTIQRKIGKFKIASEWTILLDDVGDVNLTTQAKLLRVLQNREIFRLRGNEKIDITTRVIAATNHDLENMIHTGLFRQDLFYRLNVFPIVLPSLRDRKEDIPELVSHFMKKYSIVGIDQEALALLMDMTDQEMYENCKMSSNGQRSWGIKLSLCRISLLFNINKSCLFTNIKFQNTDSSSISLKNF